jgi:hypothetical protein
MRRSSPPAFACLAALTGLCLLASAPGGAQTPLDAAAGQPSAEDQRAKLNAEQAATAKAQLDQNAANQAAFAAAVKAREDAIAASAAAAAKAQAEYEAALAANAAAQKQWEAEVAVCKGKSPKRCEKAKAKLRAQAQQ